MTTQSKFPRQAPLISLKDTVVFPESVMSLYINEPVSKKTVKQAFESDKLIFLSCLQDPDKDAHKVYRIGCLSFIMRLKDLPDGRVKILIQGKQRASIDQVEGQKVYLSYFSKREVLSEEDRKLVQDIKITLKQLLKKNRSLHELVFVLDPLKDTGHFCDMLISHLNLKVQDLQKALETVNIKDRIQLAWRIVQNELEIARMEGRIQNFLKTEAPKPFYPSSGGFKTHASGNYKKEEMKEYRQRMEEKQLPQYVQKEFLKQLSRLEKMHIESSEASMLRSYLDWLCDLPWACWSEDNLSLKNAQNILDEDHFGLTKVKERILEFLAVCHLKPKNLKGPILCFAGPPGVGKTSLGKSIARSLGRVCHRISLGGVKDEAEIRGHRRTYVGAMPGKIIQALKLCGTSNPVIVLDEIDKLCSDFRGDPSSALLEVLDPEQNHSFKDHYLNLNFDLSHVFFIGTANLAQNIPPALKDRLEIIPISGYTHSEKKKIARQHLISKELKNNGLSENHIDFTEKGLDTLISSYTKEAGLRSLSRQLASLCRKAAKKYVLGEKDKIKIDKTELADMLGSPLYYPEERLKSARVGVATGLAWTEAGGEVLYVEALKTKSKKGGFHLTGNAGDTMKESALTALSYVKFYAQFVLNMEEDFDKNEIHIHLPGLAIPKDGPSACVTLACALLSLITNIPLKNTLAMTGEISLSGRVLPVGGIKQKALAAFSNGIQTLVLPFQNKKNVEDIPKEIRDQIRFVFASHLDEVFKEALSLESLPEKAGLKEFFEDKTIDSAA